jgi:hypothetical protein
MGQSSQRAGWPVELSEDAFAMDTLDRPYLTRTTVPLDRHQANPILEQSAALGCQP